MFLFFCICFCIFCFVSIKDKSNKFLPLDDWYVCTYQNICIIHEYRNITGMKYGYVCGNAVSYNLFLLLALKRNYTNDLSYKISILAVSLSFLVCKQLLKGIIYPLVVKVHNTLELVHQEVCITVWCH